MLDFHILKIFTASLLADFASLYKFSWNWTIRCHFMTKTMLFSIVRPPFKFWSNNFYHSYYPIQYTKFHHSRRSLWDICLHNDFYVNDRPPFLICVDVIKLHPVINIHGPNIVLNFEVDWFGNFRTSLTYARLATDRQTRTSSSLKAPFLLRKAGLITVMNLLNSYFCRYSVTVIVIKLISHTCFGASVSASQAMRWISVV